jgi:hypothetical protein
MSGRGRSEAEALLHGAGMPSPSRRRSPQLERAEALRWARDNPAAYNRYLFAEHEQLLCSLVELPDDDGRADECSYVPFVTLEADGELITGHVYAVVHGADVVDYESEPLEAERCYEDPFFSEVLPGLLELIGRREVRR